MIQEDRNACKYAKLVGWGHYFGHRHIAMCVYGLFFLAKKKNLGFVVFVRSCLQRCRRHIQCATEDAARLIGGVMGGCQVSGPA